MSPPTAEERQGASPPAVSMATVETGMRALMPTRFGRGQNASGLVRRKRAPVTRSPFHLERFQAPEYSASAGSGFFSALASIVSVFCDPPISIFLGFIASGI